MKKIKNIILILLLIILCWILLHNTLRYFEGKNLNGKYDYIEIENKKMHVYDSKKGENTIVLLTGYGTSSPINDFSPLIKELSKENRVIVIEPFGYGNSEDTNKPRTIENITNEIHEVIKKLGVDEKYILMPHSISGVYSMYYASVYEEEVKMIIGNEITLPGHLLGKSIAVSTLKEDILKYSGIIRIVSKLSPSMITPDEMKSDYTKEELREIRNLAVRNYNNKSQKNENILYAQNGLKSLKTKVSSKIPMMFFVSKEVHNNPEEWVSKIEEFLNSQDKSKLVLMKGSHYLHHTKSKEMAEQINLFIKENLEK